MKETKPTGIASFKHLPPPPETTNFTDLQRKLFLQLNCHKCKNCKIKDVNSEFETPENECSLYEDIISSYFIDEIPTKTARKIGFLHTNFKGECFEFVPELQTAPQAKAHATENPAKADVKPQKVDAMNQITMF